MFFSNLFSFTILVATAAATIRDSCACSNTAATETACLIYAETRNAIYDYSSNRCGSDSALMARNQWQSACQTAGKQMGLGAVRGVCA